MSTLDAVKPSCCNEKGSNERPSNSDDCATREKQPNLKRQPSQNLLSRKPQDWRKTYEDGQRSARARRSRFYQLRELQAPPAQVVADRPPASQKAIRVKKNH